MKLSRYEFHANGCPETGLQGGLGSVYRLQVGQAGVANAPAPILFNPVMRVMNGGNRALVVTLI